MYKIGIVGYGYVGQAMHEFFGDWVTSIYDPFIPEEIRNGLIDFCRCKKLNDKESFKELDMIVISVMTKENEDWTCDTSIIESTLDWINEIEYDGVVLIKSAIVPSVAEEIQEGYCDLNIVVSPEYIGEGKYFVPFWKYPHPTEMKYHDFQIFGGYKEDTSFCVDVFVKKLGPHATYYQTDIRTAALCKYMENCWGAMKVTFCNEFFDIAEAVGVDYNELRELWTADSRVEKMHTAVFKKARGFSGKCFEKDLKAIIKDVEGDYDAKLLSKVVDRNNDFRKENQNEK